MQVWNLLHVARWKYRTQKSRQKSPSGHHRTTFSDYIFTTKAHIDNWKKNMLSSNMSSTCPHNMANFGPLAAEIDPVVWGTLQISTGFASWQRGVEQKAPPMFVRATIRLGIGPHSSYLKNHISCHVWSKDVLLESSNIVESNLSTMRSILVWNMLWACVWLSVCLSLGQCSIKMA